VTPLLGKLPFGGAAAAGDKRKNPFFCFWPFPPLSLFSFSL